MRLGDATISKKSHHHRKQKIARVAAASNRSCVLLLYISTDRQPRNFQDCLGLAYVVEFSLFLVSHVHCWNIKSRDQICPLLTL